MLLLGLTAFALVLAALVGAFSASKRALPKLPAIPARAIATQTGPPATVSLNTTFGGTQAPSGRLSALELDLARGFHFDPRAAATCSASQAREDACPSDTTIGGGTSEVIVQGRFLPRTTYPVSAGIYLTAPTHRGDIAGLVLDLTEAQSQLHAVMYGRVIPLPTSPYTIALRFANASKSLSGGYDLIVRRMALTLQASRTIDSHTYHLLTNPTSCVRHGWPLRLSMSSQQTTWIYHGKASCDAAERAQSGSGSSSAT